MNRMNVLLITATVIVVNSTPARPIDFSVENIKRESVQSISVTWFDDGYMSFVYWTVPTGLHADILKAIVDARSSKPSTQYRPAADLSQHVSVFIRGKDKSFVRFVGNKSGGIGGMFRAPGTRFQKIPDMGSKAILRGAVAKWFRMSLETEHDQDE